MSHTRHYRSCAYDPGKSHKTLEAFARRQFGGEQGPLIVKWTEAPSKGHILLSDTF